ncbi:GNAT family N-acetyltransferase [Olsenella sp. An290]|uniref:GNAT family N-acetyltransferase n=1 Tax=Olsenella sp. An290 TaxID=1965625 RepID=UPI000B371017|nr:GNAT family N-acetyltransferase [Olsenella sp. An290]OUO34330.1 GNAT family N-acetyltransferase [Olsenella sp. An290]
MQLRTPRLILRPWTASDAEALFRYARDPEVGPRAGWPAHASVEESREVIRTILSMPETYALVVRGAEPADEPVGAASLMIGAASRLCVGAREAEIGYWLGRPLWGRGYMPEAVGALVAHAFRDLRLDAVWCGYYEGNEQSRRVQEKAGLIPHHVVDVAPGSSSFGTTSEHVTRLTRAEWESREADGRR